MLQLMAFYRFHPWPQKFSYYANLKELKQNENGFTIFLNQNISQKTAIVSIDHFCLMQTHIHFLLTELAHGGIERFMRCVLNAYSRFFNLRHNRQGPLWQSRFGNTPIVDDNHLTTEIAYIRDNPVKSNLIASSNQWPYSSFSDHHHSRCGDVCKLFNSNS